MWPSSASDRVRPGDLVGDPGCGQRAAEDRGEGAGLRHSGAGQAEIQRPGPEVRPDGHLDQGSGQTLEVTPVAGREVPVQVGRQVDRRVGGRPGEVRRRGGQCGGDLLVGPAEPGERRCREDRHQSRGVRRVGEQPTRRDQPAAGQGRPRGEVDRVLGAGRLHRGRGVGVRPQRGVRGVGQLLGRHGRAFDVQHVRSTQAGAGDGDPVTLLDHDEAQPREWSVGAVRGRQQPGQLGRGELDEGEEFRLGVGRVRSRILPDNKRRVDALHVGDGVQADSDRGRRGRVGQRRAHAHGARRGDAGERDQPAALVADEPEAARGLGHVAAPATPTASSRRRPPALCAARLAVSGGGVAGDVPQGVGHRGHHRGERPSRRGRRRVQDRSGVVQGQHPPGSRGPAGAVDQHRLVGRRHDRGVAGVDGRAASAQAGAHLLEGRPGERLVVGQIDELAWRRRRRRPRRRPWP